MAVLTLRNGYPAYASAQAICTILRADRFRLAETNGVTREVPESARRCPPWRTRCRRPACTRRRHHRKKARSWDDFAGFAAERRIWPAVRTGNLVILCHAEEVAGSRKGSKRPRLQHIGRLVDAGSRRLPMRTGGRSSIATH
ncbi:hypothetical protein GCM10022222_70290 [Amycolatopsis ultiminotia]|uniref:Uncharacterized protein n=1 Tax=Amycolatopsis ultiminotia TaxID=543629 RepID=A0ABP6Y117_9PSEU